MSMFKYKSDASIVYNGTILYSYNKHIRELFQYFSRLCYSTFLLFSRVSWAKKLVSLKSRTKWSILSQFQHFTAIAYFFVFFDVDDDEADGCCRCYRFWLRRGFSFQCFFFSIYPISFIWSLYHQNIEPCILKAANVFLFHNFDVGWDFGGKQ